MSVRAGREEAVARTQCEKEVEKVATGDGTSAQGRCVPRDGGAVLTQIVGVRGVTSAVLTQNVGVRGVAWLLSL